MVVKAQSYYFSRQPDYLDDDLLTDRARDQAFKRAVGVLRDGASRYEITDTETGEVFTVTRHLIPKED